MVVYLVRGLREDHPDPVSTGNLTKWLVAASYTDENEENSLVTKNGFFVIGPGSPNPPGSHLSDI
jgi:hypothetical protein